jgi:GT2 family glycosyltransferase
MTVKIVILNWNGRAHLERFMPSVVGATPYPVVVADNGSTDGSVALLREKFPSVEVVELDRNYGFAEGYNRALEHVEADIFVLLNSDVQTPAGWCEPLVELLAVQPDIAAVQPKIKSLADPSKFEYAGAAGGFIDALGYPFCRGRILKTIEEDRGQYDDRRDIFWASGACMAVRARVFRELGGFDARFFAHMEEIDFCWRAGLAGWRIAVEPRSEVFHLGGGTLSQGSERKIYLNFRNSLMMLRKNRGGAVVWLRMVLDGGSAMVYLLTGRWRFFRAVVRAHRDYRRAPGFDFVTARGNVSATPVANIYKGSILLRYLLGWRRFGRMM